MLIKAAFAITYPNPDDGRLTPVDQLNIDGVTFPKIWCFQDFTKDYLGGEAVTLNNNNNSSVTYSCINSGIQIPSCSYWSEIDKKVLNAAYRIYVNDDNANIKDVSGTLTVDDLIKTSDDFSQCGILVQYGAIKFAANEAGDNFANLEKWTNELSNQANITIPNLDFKLAYRKLIESKASNVRACITMQSSNPQHYGNFGWGDNHYPIWIEGKDWAGAWNRGFLEGLLVYPVAAMTEIFSHAFGMNGWGQLGAILLVTFIVRTFLMLVSLKSTIGQQKMQMLQPELAKIQAKYPNANTNTAQKQRLSQEQMALYKKHHINPLSTLLVLIVQFPLFIAVWGGLQGSAALASDSVLGLYLSDSIWSVLSSMKGLPSNSYGWWTALVLVVLMALGQFISMKLPQWMQKHYAKKTPKLTANPAQDKTQRQMKWFGYIMLIIIIIMGFTLPAGMGVYWLAGALFSVTQTVIVQFAMHGTFKKQGIAIKNFFKDPVPRLKIAGKAIKHASFVVVTSPVALGKLIAKGCKNFANLFKKKNKDINIVNNQNNNNEAENKEESAPKESIDVDTTKDDQK